MQPSKAMTALTRTMNAAYNEMVRLRRTGGAQDCAWDVMRAAREAYRAEGLQPALPTDKQIRNQAGLDVKEMEGHDSDIRGSGQDAGGSVVLLDYALKLVDGWLDGADGGPRSRAARKARDRLYCLCVAVRQEIARMPKKEDIGTQNMILGLAIT